MDKYYNRLVRYLTGKLHDRQLAADVAHDAYLRVLQSSPAAGVQYPQAYLFRTASNLIVDHARRLMAQATEGDGQIERHVGEVDDLPAAQLYQQQRARLVARALDELPEVCRTVFLLRKLEGLSHPDIAARMNISRDMVEKHIVLAMKHCRVRVREMEYSKAAPLPPAAHG